MSTPGEILRQARETKGLSLAQAEEATKIRRRYLEAIEAGQFEDLPGDVYARGFVRIYARFLGIDPTQVTPSPPTAAGAERRSKSPFGSRSPAASGQTAAAAEAGRNLPSALSGAPADMRRPAPAVAPVTRSAPLRRGRSLLAALVIPAALAILGYGLYTYFRTATAPLPPAKPAAVSVPTPPAATAAPSPTPAPPPVVKPPEPPRPKVMKGAKENGEQRVWVSEGPLQVTLDFLDRAWYRVLVDGAFKEENTNPAGKPLAFAATAEIIVRIGYTDAVHFTVNGEAMGALASDNAFDVVIRVGTPPESR